MRIDAIISVIKTLVIWKGNICSDVQKSIIQCVLTLVRAKMDDLGYNKWSPNENTTGH